MNKLKSVPQSEADEFRFIVVLPAGQLLHMVVTLEVEALAIWSTMTTSRRRKAALYFPRGQPNDTKALQFFPRAIC